MSAKHSRLTLTGKFMDFTALHFAPTIQFLERLSLKRSGLDFGLGAAFIRWGWGHIILLRLGFDHFGREERAISNESLKREYVYIQYTYVHIPISR